jgi:hypothetical protein
MLYLIPILGQFFSQVWFHCGQIKARQATNANFGAWNWPQWDLQLLVKAGERCTWLRETVTPLKFCKTQRHWMTNEGPPASQSIFRGPSPPAPPGTVLLSRVLRSSVPVSREIQFGNQEVPNFAKSRIYHISDGVWEKFCSPFLFWYLPLCLFLYHKQTKICRPTQHCDVTTQCYMFRFAWTIIRHFFLQQLKKNFET